MSKPPIRLVSDDFGEATPANDDPHTEGEAICTHCRHKWHAVAPVGVTHFECPSCGTMKGTMRHPVGHAPPHMVWVCKCGSDLFMLLSAGAPMCINCGSRANTWAEG